MLKQRLLILKQDKIRLDFSANNSRKIQRSTPGGINFEAPLLPVQ